MPAVHPRRRRQQFAESQKNACPQVVISDIEPAPWPNQEIHTQVNGSGFGPSETGQAKAEILEYVPPEWSEVEVISWSDTVIILDVTPYVWCVTASDVRITNFCGNADEYSPCG